MFLMTANACPGNHPQADKFITILPIQTSEICFHEDRQPENFFDFLLPCGCLGQISEVFCLKTLRPGTST